MYVCMHVYLYIDIYYEVTSDDLCTNGNTHVLRIQTVCSMSMVLVCCDWDFSELEAEEALATGEEEALPAAPSAEPWNVEGGVSHVAVEMAQETR